MSDTIRVLNVGAGFMGTLHAKAFQKLHRVENVGIVTRNLSSSENLSNILGGDIPRFTDFEDALEKTKPDAVAISTYTDSHYHYVSTALNKGLHVFVEKPLAETMEESLELFDLANKVKRKLYVGYILMTHPSWNKFTEIAHDLGKPLAMRMNLNQQTKGEFYDTLFNIMQVQSPIVDCGVHYVDIMYQMAQSRPVRVHAIGCRNWDLVPEHICNYGQLQVEFEDGSVGWYEAGWGPMMSETAYFIKDIVGPDGAASISVVSDRSDDKDHHVEANTIIRHFAEQKDKEFVREDEIINIDEPDHEGLSFLEQKAFIDCIRNDTDMTSHQDRVMTSLQIVFAADQSQKTKQVVELQPLRA
ncbi:MAG: putative dehydrogenase [Verrucomicrobiales bacterium]|jgi:predicted dehydrogenase